MESGFATRLSAYPQTSLNMERGFATRLSAYPQASLNIEIAFGVLDQRVSNPLCRCRQAGCKPRSPYSELL
jgi:hypothetical protein